MRVFEYVAALNPECQSWEAGDFHPYEPEEIAYAMAGLSPIQGVFVRVKYNLHLNKLPELGIHWYRYAKDYWNSMGYGRPTGKKEDCRKIMNMSLVRALRKKDENEQTEWLDRLSKMSLQYNLDPHTCGVCGGHESIVIMPETLQFLPEAISRHVNAGGVVVCPECLGAGKRPQSMRQRARIADIPEPTWRLNWEPVFKDLVDECMRMEKEAAIIMDRRLGNSVLRSTA